MDEPQSAYVVFAIARGSELFLGRDRREQGIQGLSSPANSSVTRLPCSPSQPEWADGETAADCEWFLLKRAASTLYLVSLQEHDFREMCGRQQAPARFSYVFVPSLNNINIVSNVRS